MLHQIGKWTLVFMPVVVFAKFTGQWSINNQASEDAIVTFEYTPLGSSKKQERQEILAGNRDHKSVFAHSSPGWITVKEVMLGDQPCHLKSSISMGFIGGYKVFPDVKLTISKGRRLKNWRMKEKCIVSNNYGWSYTE